MPAPATRAGFATRVAGYFGTLIILGGIWAVLNPVLTSSLNVAANTSSMSATGTGVGYVRDFHEWFFLFAFLVLFVAVIAAAVFRSRRGGGVR